MGSVAILNIHSPNGISIESTVLGQLITDSRASHSEKLILNIENILSQNSIPREKIEMVAVSIGPGSFTGLRVGLSIAKGLSFALDIPLMPVGSLTAAAYPHLSKNNTPVVSFFDAKRGEVFAAAYDYSGLNWLPVQLIAPIIISFEELLTEAEGIGASFFVGDSEIDHYKNTLIKKGYSIAAKGFNLPNAISVCSLAYLKQHSGIKPPNLNSLSPHYIRRFKPGKPL